MFIVIACLLENVLIDYVKLNIDQSSKEGKVRAVDFILVLSTFGGSFCR